MKSVQKLLAACVLLVGLAGCSTEKNQNAVQKEKIVVALLPNEGAEVSAESQLLLDEIKQALGDNYEVEGVVGDDYAAVSEAILTGTAQIAWESGATYAQAHMEDENVIPLVSYGVNGDKNNAGYPAYIATNIENAADFEGKSEAEKLALLKGKSFSFVSATSTSGCLVPTTTLYNAFGPNGDQSVNAKELVNAKTTSQGGLFSEIQFGGNHPGSVQLIAEKKVYAGAFCCNYGDPYKEQLYVIAESTVPNGPLWVNKANLSQDAIDKLTHHFVNLTPENAVPNFFDKEKGFFSAENPDTADVLRFFEVSVDDYDFVYKMYAEK